MELNDKRALIDQINIEAKISLDEFKLLFSPLNLNDDILDRLDEYYKMYELFIDSSVNPKTSWLSVRNIWIVKHKDLI